MPGALFNGARKAKDLDLVKASGRDHTRNLGRPIVSVPVLSKRTAVTVRALEGTAIPKQDLPLRATIHSAEYRDGGRKDERTRSGDHQNCENSLQSCEAAYAIAPIARVTA